MKKKTLILILSAALLVVASVGGTVAYLTATTNTLTNTFTTGAITSLTLSEQKVDPTTGHPATPAARIDTSTGNKQQDYPLYPGAVLAKDPTVTVGADSVPCYVFVKYTSNIPSAAADIALNSAWKLVAGTTDIYVYSNSDSTPKIVANSASATDLTPLFTTISVKTSWDGTGATDPEISVKAYAHQANVNGTADYTSAVNAAKDLVW